MNYNRPIVISIAGFDPTGGAGLLADIKTMEQHQCIGMGVVSALTVQTEDTFMSVEWMSFGKIKEQLEPLLNTYHCPVVKIGIIENMTLLFDVVKFIKSKQANIHIVWDTVLAASSGFNLMNEFKEEDLINLLKEITIITPNTHEAIKLAGKENEFESANYLATFCDVLLKGGHSELKRGTDLLLHNGKVLEIKADEGTYFAKHGSGCILSSAIASGLAKGLSIEKACISAKQYIQTILKSNEQLLAYHVQ